MLFNLKDICINSFNVNGLRADNKRKDVFRYLKSHQLDLILLQETHSTAEDEKLWTIEWGGKIWFSHGTSQSKGVAILTRRTSPFIITEIEDLFEGRLIIINIDINGFAFVLANFYAPNEDNEEFFVQAFQKLDERDNPSMILSGDFNTALNPKLDSNCNTDNHKKKRKIIQEYLEDKDLTDVWRLRNPDKFQYSWKRDKLAKTASRLDYFFVSESLLNRVNKVELIPGYKSDHWRLEMQINFESNPRGKGFWKFNTSYLKDLVFVEKMNELIDTHIWDVKENITPAQNWEYLKLKITTFCVEYSIQKAKEKNKLIEQLENRIKILNEQLLNCQDNTQKENIANKMAQTEKFLQNEHEEKALKIALRNKAKWHNQGERSSKYFFNLERARYNSKVVTKIQSTEGNILTDPKEILNELRKQFATLFKEEKENRPFPYINVNEPRLTNEQSQKLEQPLSTQELGVSLQGMANGKTPGSDGLSAEFYKVFWSRLQQTIFEALTYALQEGLLHTSARRGILSLLPKKDRNLLIRKSWRPITLLNVDYKILSRALALRMKNVLPSIISEDQTGFMAGRNININIRKVLDIMQIAEKNNLRAVIMSVDFDSCFDRMAWSALDGALNFFGFGPNFRKYVETLLRGSEACVLNNGHTSKYLSITRSSRQGCNISPFLFLCCAELISIQIRNNQKIKGIKIGETEFKMIQFADDMNLPLMYEEESFLELSRAFDTFSLVSGFKVNYDKTSVYRIGSLKNTNAKFYSTRHLNWTNEPIRVLGTTIGHDQEACVQKDIDGIVSKMESVSRLWQNRDLSLIGKVLIINSLMGSLLVYRLSTTRFLTSEQINKINDTIRQYLWKGKRPKIALAKLQNDKEYGGLKLLDVRAKDKALKIKWVFHYKAFNKIKDLADQFIHQDLRDFFWKCNLGIKDVQSVVSNGFWRDVAQAWAEINHHTPATELQVLKEIVWGNSFIKIGGKILTSKQAWLHGCRTIGDFWKPQENRFMTYTEFVAQFGDCLTPLQFNGLVTSIPRTWKELLREKTTNRDDHAYELRFINIDVKISTQMYLQFIEKPDLLMETYIQWTTKLNISTADFSFNNFLDCFVEIRNLTSSPKYHSFQFRLLHRKIFLNSTLKRWGISNTDRCTLCELEYETIEHFFYFCNKTQIFWNQCRTWYECMTDTEIEFTADKIMFNNFDNQIDNHMCLNMIILLAKQYLFSQRCLQKDTYNFYHFKDRLKEICKYEMMEAKYKSKTAIRKFKTRWSLIIK